MSVPFLKWDDPLSWMERRTAKTREAIKDENQLFKATVAKSGSKEALELKRKEFQRTFHSHSTTPVLSIPSYGPAEIIIEMNTMEDGVFRWKRAKGGTWVHASGIDVSDDGSYTVAYAVEMDEPYDYKLHVKTPTRSWKHSHGGGPYVAIKGGLVYYLEEDRHLQYKRLISLSLADGKERTVIYEESNPTVQITLMKGENRCLFLMRENGGYQEIGIIESGTVCRWLKGGVVYFPVGYRDLSSETPIYFLREKEFNSPWKLFGANWILNDEIKMDGIEFCSSTLNILVTKSYGVRTIWRLYTNRSPKLLFRNVFEIYPYTRWPFWRGEAMLEKQPLWIRDPTCEMYPIFCGSEYIDIQRRSQYAFKRVGASVSADGLPVRWILLTEKKGETPKGLMLVAYGAYGLKTSLNTIRWVPWLKAGWAVAIVFVRGGGDGNEMWADLGRLSGKKQGVEDMEAACRDLQEVTGCVPKKTCIFGRSAGGLLVGNMVSSNPSGELFGNVYAEVPYVDLLKTASNPALPLTAYEFKEFGNPVAGPLEFQQALEISPIHTLGPLGAPNINVLCRSGEQDIQVYPYESLKWIYTLRGKNGKDTSKVLYINRQSHTTYGRELYVDLAEDFLVINHWILSRNGGASTGTNGL